MSSYILPFVLSLAMHTDYNQVLYPEPQYEALEVPQYIEHEVEATFYTAYCKGCIGITKTGDDVRQTIYANGMRVIAVDPKIIPLRSIVEVELENGTTFEAIASDTGGAIKGARIDVLVKTTDEALKLGRQTAKVRIKGGEDDVTGY